LPDLAPKQQMYRLILLLVLTAIVCLLSACVERYYPEDDDLTTGTLVINAHITDKPGIQSVEVSRSGGLNFGGFDPVVGCYVLLLREDSESRDFLQSRPGYYSCDLESEFLQSGMSYQLQVITSDGEEYHSDFDRLRPVPEIDSLYYQVETTILQSTGDTMQGIRYYLDFTYDDEVYEFIRWEITETYEFHNPSMEAFVMPNRWTVYPLPDTSNWIVCYITKNLQDIHAMSMKDLDQGVYIKKPFTFVPNDIMEQKLLYKYSVLIKQLSVGQEAYYYWNELKKTSQEQGWLFDSQPALLKSNICNIHDESEKVLGFFTMSGLRERRHIAANIPGIDHRPYKYYCLPFEKGPGVSMSEYFPAYYARAHYDGKSVYEKVNKHCVDCREYRGSSHIKPDYW
jgi:Domain of unknown function (DUF4249)